MYWKKPSGEKELQDSEGQMETIFTRWVYNLLFFLINASKNYEKGKLMKTQSYSKSYNTIIVCIVMPLPKKPVMDFMGLVL